MLEKPLRQAATWLLEAAVRIAPAEVRGWGEAMRSELQHIESGWAGLSWALGSAVVLAKHTLISLLIPWRRRPGISSSPGLLTKGVSVRKAALASAGVFVLAALIFFAAPPFRQGLRISLAPWRAIYRLSRPTDQSGLRAFAKRAEARRDPQAMIFAAVRLADGSESPRLADEAVRIDPRLFWAYAVVAARHSTPSAVRRWLPELERWQPQNALFPLIAAQSSDLDHIARASNLSPAELHIQSVTDPAWQQAMARAFASPKFDDYLNRLHDLDREVARRYRITDPYVVLSGEEYGLPSLAFANAHQFAKALLQSGATLEARGNRNGAEEKYWAIARFGQVIDAQARVDSERLMGVALQAMAYQQLHALAKSEGNTHEAALFSYLVKQNASLASERHRERLFGWYVTSRNAVVLQLSGLGMLFFSALLVFAASLLIAGSRKDGWWRRARSGITVVALAGGVGLLLASATVYLTYRPYWYIFQDIMQRGDAGQAHDLLRFLAAAQFPPGPRGNQLFWLHFPVYFWAGVIFAAIAALVFILLRHVREHTRPNEIQANPRVT